LHDLELVEFLQLNLDHDIFAALQQFQELDQEHLLRLQENQGLDKRKSQQRLLRHRLHRFDLE